jgi:hypothetical protein
MKIDYEKGRMANLLNVPGYSEGANLNISGQ